MIYINRLKRDAFYADERLKRDSSLLTAVEAARAGVVLDEQQMMLLDDERVRLEDKERRKRDGLGIQKFFFGGGLKSFLLAGLDKEESRKVERLKALQVDVEINTEKGSAMDSVQEIRLEGNNAVGDNRGEGQKASEGNAAVGGPLDQMAERATELAKSKARWGGRWSEK